ncbi:hypothetical protein KCP78_19620 [Salmonella enterica subsp. enterica]|nr:hypothetical protein KCP78_19620 [Salmonella enterica subsp. enterica]
MLRDVAGQILRLSPAGDDDIGDSIRKQLVAIVLISRQLALLRQRVYRGGADFSLTAKSENVIGIHAGANAALSPALVDAQRERIAQADALLMQRKSPLESVLAAAKIAHQHHTTVALNPAPARGYRMNCWRFGGHHHANETEAEKLTGVRCEKNGDDAAKAAQVL